MSCHYCSIIFDEDDNPVKCSSCKEYLYCSNECMEADWEAEHYAICHQTISVPTHLHEGTLHITDAQLDLSQYEVVSTPVGKGAYGKVVTVRSIKTHATHAMKIIDKQHATKLCCTAAAQFEIYLHTVISHPNIIHAIGWAEDSLNFYLILELAEYNLFQYMRSKKLKESEIHSLYMQICSGIYFLHSNGFLHRDIKPENILLKNGVAKICDFGCAVRTGSASLRKCGTLEYLSPELLSSITPQHSIAQDLWSLGVLLYEMKYRRSPFKGKKNSETIYNIISKSTFSGHIDNQCDDLINKLTNKLPYKRPCWNDIFNHPWMSGSLNPLKAKLLGCGSCKVNAKMPDEDIPEEICSKLCSPVRMVPKEKENNPYSTNKCKL